MRVLTARWNTDTYTDGKSNADVGAATITGVPPFGFPNTSNIVLGISNPARFASPVKSIFANNIIPFAASNC